MKKGPKPIPLHVLEQRGSRHARDPKRLAAIVPASGKMQKPKWLKGMSSDLWDDYAQEVLNMGACSSADAPAFARYCQLLADWIDAVERCNKIASKHARMPSRLMSMPSLHKALVEAEHLFGMTPSDRVGLHTPMTPGKMSEQEKKLSEKKKSFADKFFR